MAQVAGGSDADAVQAGELWADAVIAGVAAVPGPQRAAWATLTDHAGRATGGRPTGTWAAAASGRSAALDPVDVSARLAAGLPAFPRPRPARQNEHGASTSSTHRSPPAGGGTSCG